MSAAEGSQSDYYNEDYHSSSREDQYNDDHQKWSDTDPGDSKSYGSEPTIKQEIESPSNNSLEEEYVDTQQELRHTYKNDVNEENAKGKNPPSQSNPTQLKQVCFDKCPVWKLMGKKDNDQEASSTSLAKSGKSSRKNGDGTSIKTGKSGPEGEYDSKSTKSKNGSKDASGFYHRKCSVVQLVRNQMSTLDDRFTEEKLKCTRCANAAKGWKKKFIVLLIIVPFLIWAAIIYGALAGASLCGGKSLCVKNPYAVY